MTSLPIFNSPIVTEQIPVIILAGGLGTRLRSVISDRPKVLVPISGKPILLWVMERLARDGFIQFVLSVGYQAEEIRDYFGNGSAWGWRVSYAVENVPLGTAGGIRNTLNQMGVQPSSATPLLITNGDTYINATLRQLFELYNRRRGLITLGLQKVVNVSRFGTVRVSRSGRILSFSEKRARPESGLVNVGIYLVKPRILDFIPSGRAVSLESETFPSLLVAHETMFGVVLDGSFIDIGTVEGYREMQRYANEAAIK